MEEQDGRVVALPCCRGWIRETYGFVDSAPLAALWNSVGAQRIRDLIASGRQNEICDHHCKYLTSGQFREEAWEGRIIDGPADLVANQNLNNEEIRMRRTVLESRPVMMKVITSLQCNIRCTMCFQKHFGHVDLGTGFWEQVEAHLPFAHEAIFQGGEATTDPGFRAFLSSSGLQAQPHVGVGLITKGTVFDDSLQEAIKKVRIKFVNISINAATANTYEAVTKRNLFGRVLANTQRWLEIATDHQYGRFPVYASFVVMRSNFKELPDFVRLVHKMGAILRLRMTEGNAGEENVLVHENLLCEFRNVLDEVEHSADHQTLEEIQALRHSMSASRYHSQDTSRQLASSSFATSKASTTAGSSL